MAERKFTCEACGDEFLVDVTEATEKATQAEYEAIHKRTFKKEEAAIICDDCHKILLRLIETGEIQIPKTH